METSIVSVRVDDIRPKYRDLYEWCQDSDNIYIGRGYIVTITRNGETFRYPPPSPFANPFKGENAIEKYRSYLIDELSSGSITLDQLENLKGKTLGCWCKTKKNPEAKCHGDVIVELIKELCP